MTAGDSKAATTITQPALAPSPQPRPAPTRRALPSKPVAQRGQNWTPIRGQIWEPIDSGFFARKIDAIRDRANRRRLSGRKARQCDDAFGTHRLSLDEKRPKLMS